MEVKRSENAYKVPTSARRTASEIAYQQAKAEGIVKPLAEEPSIKEWTHWRLIDNRFPYDMIFRVHHMLIPKRVVAERDELNEAEIRELQLLRDLEFKDTYDLVFENFPKRRSILNHYHLHLASYYEDRLEMKL